MKNYFLSGCLLTTALFSTSGFAGDLTYQTYNPQKQGIFPVSSTLISGDHDAILVDAQFSVKDSQQLVKLIKDSGKQLKYIVITAGDPDFYFGLEPLVHAFPDAKIVASKQVVEHIEATKDAKIAYWTPILKDGAPHKVYVPSIAQSSTFKLEGKKIELKDANSYAAYLWVPSSRLVLGGVGISSGLHVWTADTQTKSARDMWRKTLTKIEHMKPKVVIPGHYIGAMPQGTEAVKFTFEYLNHFEHALKAHQTSAPLIQEMKNKYPNLAEENSLELSSKVNTGEMKW